MAMWLDLSKCILHRLWRKVSASHPATRESEEMASLYVFTCLRDRASVFGHLRTEAIFYYATKSIARFLGFGKVTSFSNKTWHLVYNEFAQSCSRSFVLAFLVFNTDYKFVVQRWHSAVQKGPVNSPGNLIYLYSCRHEVHSGSNNMVPKHCFKTEVYAKNGRKHRAVSTHDNWVAYATFQNVFYIRDICTSGTFLQSWLRVPHSTSNSA